MTLLSNKIPRGSGARLIGEIIERGYMQLAQPSGDKQKKSFAPSQIGYGHGRCARYWSIAFDGAWFESDVEALNVGNMEYGKQAHERLQTILDASEEGFVSEAELRMENPPIFGFIDSIIFIDNEPIIIEIKTTRAEAYLAREYSMKAPEYHMIQILLYMYITGIQKGALIYENKSTQEILTIPIKLTEEKIEYIEGVLTWLKEVKEAYDNNELPENVFRSNSKICKGCPVQKECLSRPKGDIKIEALKV